MGDASQRARVILGVMTHAVKADVKETEDVREIIVFVKPALLMVRIALLFRVAVMP
jgi:hypothetical protein